MAEAAYRHILFPADFSPEQVQVGARVAELAQRTGAKVTLLTVVGHRDLAAGPELALETDEIAESRSLEDLQNFTDPATLAPGIDQRLTLAARRYLDLLAERLGIADADKEVVISGSVKNAIIETARQKQADVIVVGAHDRHGLAVLIGLLNSAVDGLVHGAPCDVLVVRIRPPAAGGAGHHGG